MSDVVSVSVPVSYRKFAVPKDAAIQQPPGRRQDGLRPAPTTPLSQLAPEALDALVSAWLTDVYAAAGRENPYGKKSVEPRRDGTVWE